MFTLPSLQAATAASTVVLADGSVWIRQPVATGGTLLRGGESRPGKQGPEAAAVDFLGIAAPVLDFDASSLLYRRTRGTRLGSLVEFDQALGGMRVLGGEVRVLVDPAHSVRHVSATCLHSDARPATVAIDDATVCAAVALREARAVSPPATVRSVQGGLFWRTGERAWQYYATDSFGAVGLYTVRASDWVKSRILCRCVFQSAG